MEILAQLVNNLFRTHRRSDGREYSNVDVSRALDGAIDPSYLTKIRQGKVPNPTRNTLLLLCQFFQVPPNYFFPELDNVASKATPDVPVLGRDLRITPEIQQQLTELLRLIRLQQEGEDSNGTDTD